MKHKIGLLLLMLAAALLGGCNIVDIPPAHRAWTFEESAFGTTRGFIGDILDPGSHSIGVNNEAFMVQCSEGTAKEPFESPTKDGVVFGTDIYIRYAANCSDAETVKWILRNLQPNPSLQGEKGEGQAAPTDAAKTVTAFQLFQAYIRPTLGEAVRDSISGQSSDSINTKRPEIAAQIDRSFRQKMKKSAADSKRPELVTIGQVDLSNIHFPKAMQETIQRLANVKTEVELEKENARKVNEQIETEKKQKELALMKAQKAGSEISELGRVIRENPEYLTYLRITTAPATFEALGKGGGTLVFGDEQLQLMLGGKK